MEELTPQEIEREISEAERHFQRMDAKARRLDALKSAPDKEKLAAFGKGEVTRREIVSGDSRYRRGELNMLSANPEVISALNVHYAPLLGAMRKMREHNAGFILIFAPVAQLWTSKAPACSAPANAYLSHFEGFSVCDPAVVGIDSATAKTRLQKLFSLDPEKTMKSIFIAISRAQLLVWRHPFLMLREPEFLTSIASEFQHEIQKSDAAVCIVTGWFAKLGLESPFSLAGSSAPAVTGVAAEALEAAQQALAEIEEDGGDMYTFTPGM